MQAAANQILSASTSANALSRTTAYPISSTYNSIKTNTLHVAFHRILSLSFEKFQIR